jgi:hypothetical protein
MLELVTVWLTKFAVVPSSVLVNVDVTLRVLYTVWVYTVVTDLLATIKLLHSGQYWLLRQLSIIYVRCPNTSIRGTLCPLDTASSWRGRAAEAGVGIAAARKPRTTSKTKGAHGHTIAAVSKIFSALVVSAAGAAVVTEVSIALRYPVVAAIALPEQLVPTRHGGGAVGDLQIGWLSWVVSAA